MRGNRAQDAVPLLESALRAKPDDPKVHLQLAEARRLSGDWSRAQPEYEEVLKRDPKNGRAELGIAESLLHTAKLDEAGPHFLKAAELDPSLKSFQLEYAVALADGGRGKDAIPILEQFSDNPGASEKLGQIYIAENEPAKAAAAFERAVRMSPTPANRVALATAYLRSGQELKAAPLLEEALAESPTDWELQMTVGRIYRDQKNFAKAAGYFATAARLKPDAPEAYSELAGVLTMAQQYGPALGALDRLRALHAEKPGHLYLRAIILDKLRQLKPALASYQEFLRVSNGQNPDQEFQARGRVKALEHEVNGR
jgi:tetratricopeptide (TPR) repeat protein